MDNLEGAAEDATPLAPPVGVVAAAGLDAVGGGELLPVAPVEVRRPQRVVVGAYLSLFRAAADSEDQICAISARD